MIIDVDDERLYERKNDERKGERVWLRRREAIGIVRNDYFFIHLD